ncbi:MAG: DUF2062 domain-containing protein [Rickettsiales bacterium]|jgi:uncharacterized protein (DUF2062 family)|nr:DUF2062 domain-containing protein [Rickettsiales bacterium]
MLKKINKIIRRIFRYIVRSFKDKENRNPAYLGRSFAVGFFSGMWVLWGQTGIAIAIWFLAGRTRRFRFNVVLACLTTLITNPLTTPAWFYLYYLTGQAMLGGKAIEFANFAQQLKPLLETLDLDSIVNSIKLLAKGIGRPIMIGSIPWYPIIGAIGYYIGARVSVHLRRKRLHKRKHRIRRLIGYLKKIPQPFSHHDEKPKPEEKR